MLRLNEHGWGMKFLIVMAVIFISILIGVSIAIKNLINSTKSGSNKETSNSSIKSYSSTYDKYEYSLVKAGEKYIDNHHTLFDNTHDDVVVPLNALVTEGLTDSLQDPNTYGFCDGYIVIDTNKNIKSYIKCADYVTSGYYE